VDKQKGEMQAQDMTTASVAPVSTILHSHSLLSNIWHTIIAGLPRQILLYFSKVQQQQQQVTASPSQQQQKQLAAPLRTHSFILCYLILALCMATLLYFEKPYGVCN